jgi:membrane-associated phospholipid phosphatase
VSAADPYTPLLNRLDAIGAEGGALMARLNQTGLWEFHRHDRWTYFGGISAMPGLHVGIAVLFAVVALQRSKPLGVLLILYAVSIQVGSVVLAWHYAVDGYLGAVLAIVCWHVAGALTRQPALADPVRGRSVGEYRR